MAAITNGQNDDNNNLPLLAESQLVVANSSQCLVSWHPSDLRVPSIGDCASVSVYVCLLDKTRIVFNDINWRTEIGKPKRAPQLSEFASWHAQ